jgi:uncharacterized protein (TIGR03435 family)
MTRLAGISSLFIAAALTGTLRAQAPALPAFDVVSVRPNTSIGGGGSISGPSGSQFRVVNVALRQIVIYAYDLRDVELVDIPEWTRTARFDIAATYPEGAVPAVQYRLMIQKLLADRFQLQVRNERRDLPVYTLTIARPDKRLGPSLVPSDVDCTRWLAEKRPQFIGTPPIGPGGARPACLMVTQRNYIVGGTRTIAALARGLESAVGRPVIDETGLSGTFDIALQWTPEPGIDVQPATTPTAEGASLFTAIQEQLGLALKSARAVVPVVAVGRIERPAPD